MQKKQKATGKSLLPQAKQFSQQEPVYIPLFLADPTKKVQMVWELQCQNGHRDAGTIKRNAFSLPAGLPKGKHQLTVIVGKPLLQQGVKMYHCELTINA